MFIKDYKFAELPKGFKKVPAWDDKTKSESKTEFDTIKHIINYYHGKDIRSNEDIHKEIIEYNKLLLDWASKLPDINERTD